LGEKLSAQKKIEENGADGIRAKADVTNLANNEEGIFYYRGIFGF
jgi:hypothetical protein